MWHWISDLLNEMAECLPNSTRKTCGGVTIYLSAKMIGSIPFHVISRAVICGLAAANGVTAGDPNDVVIIIIIPMNNISFFWSYTIWHR
jgi:hypothetical protein